MMRHDALRTIDLHDDLTRIRRDLLMRIQGEVGRADERLGEIHRIVDEDDPRQIVAVADEMFGDDRQIAARNPVAANPSHLEMRRGDRQHVAFPHAGREALPRVSGVVGRMRAAVHPDRPLGRLP